MISAGVRTLCIYSALTSGAVKEKTVTVRESGKGEQLGLLGKMFDNAFFRKAFGDGFHVVVEFEFIHQFHSNQICWAYLNRQIAAACITVAAEFFRKFLPCGRVVYS